MAPDGKLLAGVGDSPDVLFWDTATAKTAKELKGHADWVVCLCFSADGKQLISGGYQGDALLWDAVSGNKIRELPAPPAQKPKDPPPVVPISAVAIDAEGKQALLGRTDGSIDQVNLANGQKVRTLTGHGAGVTGLVYHPGGTLAVSSSKDGTIRLWDPANGNLVKELKDHTAWVEDVALLDEGTKLVSVGADRTVRVWNRPECFAASGTNPSSFLLRSIQVRGQSVE
jgi:WD40 repeat protein